MPDNPPTIRAAAVQHAPVVLDREATVEEICALIREASNDGAEPIVFPELFIPTDGHTSIWSAGLAGWTLQSIVAWSPLLENPVEIPDPLTDSLWLQRLEEYS